MFTQNWCFYDNQDPICFNANRGISWRVGLHISIWKQTDFLSDCLRFVSDNYENRQHSVGGYARLWHKGESCRRPFILLITKRIDSIIRFLYRTYENLHFASQSTPGNGQLALWWIRSNHACLVILWMNRYRPFVLSLDRCVILKYSPHRSTEFLVSHVLVIF